MVIQQANVCTSSGGFRVCGLGRHCRVFTLHKDRNISSSLPCGGVQPPSQDGYGYWWVSANGFSFFHNEGGFHGTGGPELVSGAVSGPIPTFRGCLERLPVGRRVLQMDSLAGSSVHHVIKPYMPH